MQTFMKADIFFFVTTIAVVVFTIAIVVFVIYLIGAVRKFDRLADTADAELKGAGKDLHGIVTDVRESRVFSFLFPRNKKRSRTAK